MIKLNPMYIAIFFYFHFFGIKNSCYESNPPSENISVSLKMLEPLLGVLGSCRVVLASKSPRRHQFHHH